MASAVCLQRILVALAILFAVSCPSVSQGQQALPAKPSPGKAAPLPASLQARSAHRPRIELALSGGGALGMAHIGVLQWLEEHRIPVDRIGRIRWLRRFRPYS